ncbi:MAG: enoyl-[acyl-carrier-protein] reductase FabV [Pseudomonadales bacterium]|jgi:enoyl-[acyl-carrier protein] reductase / trans-2-enoyl-CoA reductase (NAD+)|uniref:enoyl-ACP reductase FabV n=1 Tax=unclassified Ketobacter TaxID=2639109 RepID=UPI000C43125A|nr:MULTISPECIES: enoyl-ACP reductase FabV [unclassified Ketobacter]MAA59853.1 enoyl-[acyl-carrier-protein] reductase FabV [Pseudomonadales bacterium]MEC8811842.1 enoyl-ACP reductase FabV [Pseudomonadota bacterium]TNC86108.1 MAG: enoyl-[acyl-carrier-protein] reductase FabV [Alcanivorax sp.]HAG93814.1 bifunctional NADH-specific enoyl-ACP reductase/trans-2-enoyl-CoA reductase [Gammaproteobacteria bacterium]MAQ26666.1 enoyl-[acyl-carrier-protein] reductase FabV [Pseudomonadales bacterium]|tara:strand:+ start:41484 stop:42665 length:1182 start_codon:yes stop_codon:yes gene_type:complete
MVISPRVKGFICTTSHPTGCAANVQRQIEFVKQQGNIADAPKRVLVIGASTGYGLASRITAAFGGGASTVGVFFEKPAYGKRTASAGWYNAAAFQQAADEAGLYSKNINGDAFSHAIKAKAIDLIKQDLGQVDLVVYSLASPRRQHPDTGAVYSSTLKPIGKAVTQTGLDTDKEIIKQFTLEPATQDEIDNTVAVMGGEDWEMWMAALDKAGVLAAGCKTTSYTYVGEDITRDIYWDGTIGAAKKDLDRAAAALRDKGFDARVSVLKAVVTQSSAAIPVMPLYLALLFRVMKEQGTHEGCIEQIYRLFDECLYNTQPRRDSDGRNRVDEKEVTPEVQQEVAALWPQVTTENLNDISDFRGFRTEFMQLFGFNVEGVDYDAEVDPNVALNNLLD